MVSLQPKEAGRAACPACARGHVVGPRPGCGRQLLPSEQMDLLAVGSRMAQGWAVAARDCALLTRLRRGADGPDILGRVLGSQ